MKRSTGLTEGVNLVRAKKNCPPAVVSKDGKYIKCSICKSWQGYKTYRRDETQCLLTCKGCHTAYITDDTVVNANHAIKYAAARNKKGCRYVSDKYEPVKQELLRIIRENPGCNKQVIYKEIKYNISEHFITSVLTWLG